jgi:molybdate transport system ATP-binding protein
MAAEIAVQVRKSFGTAFRLDIAFDAPLAPPSVLVLFGPSGAGKSTVLRCLAGLDWPDEGMIHFGSEIWFDGSHQVPPQDRHVGYMFQDYALFQIYSVAHNIGYGLGSLGGRERAARVTEVVRLLELQGLEEQRPSELSGGQQQRVALARAIARRPRLLLLDEPLSALDVPTRVKLRDQLRALLKRLAIPTIIVTHDWEEALALGDRMVVIKDGVLLQSGTPQEIFNHPSNAEVAKIVGMETVMPGVMVDTHDGLATVEVAGVKLQALAAGSAEANVFVCIRAEDVVLERSGLAASSARNHLPGRVREIVPLGAVARVEIDCGFGLSAIVTRSALDDLRLRVGEAVTAAIKAGAIHLVPRLETEISSHPGEAATMGQ